jgi:hypothetical protein
MSLSLIAVIASSLILALGAVSLVREAGYEFDLRRKPKRRVLGGRRVSDRA